jgi:metal-sulfur cluster biosynthetic enzyme
MSENIEKIKVDEKEIVVENPENLDVEDHNKKYGTPEEVYKEIIKYLKTIYDPEIPVNIYDLGLIYDIKLIRKPDGYQVYITMTLTSVVCPVGESIVDMVRSIANKIDAVTDVEVNLVFDPPWDRSKMSDEAKLVLGMM